MSAFSSFFSFSLRYTNTSSVHCPPALNKITVFLSNLTRRFCPLSPSIASERVPQAVPPTTFRPFCAGLRQAQRLLPGITRGVPIQRHLPVDSPAGRRVWGPAVALGKVGPLSRSWQYSASMFSKSGSRSTLSCGRLAARLVLDLVALSCRINQYPWRIVPEVTSVESDTRVELVVSIMEDICCNDFGRSVAVSNRVTIEEEGSVSTLKYVTSEGFLLSSSVHSPFVPIPDRFQHGD